MSGRKDYSYTLTARRRARQQAERTARAAQRAREDREDIIRLNHERFFVDHANPFHPNRISAQLTDIANLCDGLATRDLLGLAKLSRKEELGLDEEHFKQLIDHFRFGKRENAWQKIRTETLTNAAERLRQRVQGQDQVIKEVIPTLIRAKLDLVDITNQIHSSKPRGVFFFVGPTGVGKTELSKAIAELIFGDESQMTRFDMSEYSEEHQQARLIGAPPGYVGFDQGGQLPNAILEQPFSVLLFDEIEKADPRILDKFLQILDDGRLTDGSGRTVYFLETIIIFTSNLGTGGHQNEELGHLDYSDLREHFQREVCNFFVNELQRPEILNRIGEDNILVFNYLRDETTRNKIIERQIQNLAKIIRKRFRFGIQLTEPFRNVLKFHPSGFQSNGVRGVRNLLRKLVFDELALQIFQDVDAFANRTFVVDYDNVATIEEGFEFSRESILYEWD
ncbi:MAG: AAA family ATPase [Planctomycetaceae bacterium]